MTWTLPLPARDPARQAQWPTVRLRLGHQAACRDIVRLHLPGYAEPGDPRLRVRGPYERLKRLSRLQAANPRAARRRRRSPGRSCLTAAAFLRRATAQLAESVETDH